MAEITIRLRRDPQTGKQEVLIDMESDQDALPHEHEQMHREAVEKIIGKLKRDGIIVDREDESVPAAPQESPTPQREAHKQGSV